MTNDEVTSDGVPDGHFTKWKPINFLFFASWDLIFIDFFALRLMIAEFTEVWLILRCLVR